VFGQHQGVEHQVVIDHGFDGGRQLRLQHPGHVGDVLDHGAQADELGIRRQRRDGLRRHRALEVHPADHSGDELVVAGQLQQVQRLGDGGRRLHQHGRIDARAGQLRREVRR
jgi:hypothetical protein